MKALTPEVALAIAEGRARERAALVKEIRETMRGWYERGLPLAPFEHGSIADALGHELLAVRAEFGDSLARSRRYRRKISRGRRAQVYRRDGYTCQRCGWKPPSTAEARRAMHVRRGRHLTVDHILPESEGGTSDLWNLQTLCSSCNADKAHELPEAADFRDDDYTAQG